MTWINDTVVTGFILLGFSDNPMTQIFLFVIFLLIYSMILIGNTLIITAIATEKSLHTPMYFFLTNLSVMDILYSTSSIPRMLRDFLSVQKNISYAECVAQMYISLALGQAECVLLAIMAYDRYVAICYPLHYTTIINRSVCIKMSGGTWIFGFLLPICTIALVWNINLCGHNKINHFLCEEPEILSLGCGNIAFIESFIYVVGVIILLIPVSFIFISYIKIIQAILKISSGTGQRKTFSTCGSHMIVVTLFYGSAIAAYMKPRSRSSSDTDKIIAVFYVVITPLLNPLIYTLRNKEVKNALRKMRVKKKVFL